MYVFWPHKGLCKFLMKLEKQSDWDTRSKQGGLGTAHTQPNSDRTENR